MDHRYLCVNKMMMTSACHTPIHKLGARAGAPQEYERRYKIWRSNLDFVTAHNTAHKSHWVS
jgi:hypothetical protein